MSQMPYDTYDVPKTKRRYNPIVNPTGAMYSSPTRSFQPQNISPIAPVQQSAPQSPMMNSYGGPSGYDQAMVPGSPANAAFENGLRLKNMGIKTPYEQASTFAQNRMGQGDSYGADLKLAPFMGQNYSINRQTAQAGADTASMMAPMYPRMAQSNMNLQGAQTNEINTLTAPRAGLIGAQGDLAEAQAQNVPAATEFTKQNFDVLKTQFNQLKAQHDSLLRERGQDASSESQDTNRKQRQANFDATQQGRQSAAKIKQDASSADAQHRLRQNYVGVLTQAGFAGGDIDKIWQEANKRYPESQAAQPDAPQGAATQPEQQNAPAPQVNHPAIDAATKAGLLPQGDGSWRSRDGRAYKIIERDGRYVASPQ